MTDTADILTHSNPKPTQDTEVEGQNDEENSRHPYHMLVGQYSANLNVNGQQNTDNTFLSCHNPAPHLSSISSAITKQKELRNRKRVTFKQQKEGRIIERVGTETDRECDQTPIGSPLVKQKSTDRKTSKVNLEKASSFLGRVRKSEVATSRKPAVHESGVDDYEVPSCVMKPDKDDSDEPETELGRFKRKRGRKRVSLPGWALYNVIRNLSCHSQRSETSVIPGQGRDTEQKPERDISHSNLIQLSQNEKVECNADRERSNQQNSETVPALPEFEFEVYDNDELLDVESVFEDLLDRVENLSLENFRSKYYSSRTKLLDVPSAINKINPDDSGNLWSAEGNLPLFTGGELTEAYGSTSNLSQLSESKKSLRNILQPKANLIAPLRSIKRPRLSDNDAAVRFYRAREQQKNSSESSHDWTKRVSMNRNSHIAGITLPY